MGCVPSMRVSHRDVTKRESLSNASTGERRAVNENCGGGSGVGRVGSGSVPGEEQDSYSNCVNAAPPGSGYAGKDLAKTSSPHHVGFTEEMALTEMASSRQNGGRTGISGSANDVFLGPLKIQHSPMSILLVFAKKDAQCDAIQRAAEMAKYSCHVAATPETAVQLYNDYHHNVIIVDTRPKRNLDAEGFARQIRALRNGEHAVLAAVRPLTSPDKEDQSMLTLLKAGFNRQFLENSNVGVCMNELQCMEFGEVRAQMKLRATQALIIAVENATDAVEITNENHEIQYVNSTFEKMFGYSGDEVIGKNFHDISRLDKTKNDITDAINDQLRNGKPWHGTYHIQRKNGENLPQKCRLYPVLSHSGKISHFVGIRSSAAVESSNGTDQTNGCISHSPVPEAHTKRSRRDSASKVQSMSIEAPITKAISMISSLQETCPTSLVEPLDRVLEVLRSSELYSPYFTQQVRDDKMTSELVGGLMKIDDDLWNHKKVSSAKRLSCSSETPYLVRSHSHMSGLASSKTPAEVQTLLDAEESWDFDIIQLERLTEKRPLVHLAMRTFQRYEVLQFLQVEEGLMFAWLQMIESNYHANNPYHNSTHAADVMHATSYFLACDKIKNMFDQFDEVACLIAAVVHDLDHPGRTNTYFVNSSAELAILYNDSAVLENHHVSLAYSLTLKNDSINIFRNLSRDDYRSLRQQVVDMVLATEMTKHFEHLARFVSVVNKPPPPEDEAPPNPSDNRTLVKRMLIKCADVSNPARPLNLCIEWATRIANEYCQQTDDEKAHGLPLVMPMFDRRTCNVPESQTRFVDIFIRDMFEAWSKFCSLPEMTKYIKENYKYWKEKEAIVAEKLQETQNKKNSDEDKP